MLDIVKKRARAHVEAAGGRYVGTLERLVLFNSRESGSTLALPISEVLNGGPAAVRAHILESNRRFGLT